MRLFLSERLGADLSKLERICVFSHFDANNRIADYVKHYIQTIASAGFAVIFVSTSDSISQENISELLEICAIVCQRVNSGYDFGSYKTGIDLISARHLKPSQLVLANDSVYGPFGEIEYLLEFGEKHDLDIWGCTDSFQYTYHLQSYFLSFGKRAIESKPFLDFWSDEKIFELTGPEAKPKIIERYELKITQYFINYGFRVGAAYSFEKIFQKYSEIFFREIGILKRNSSSSRRDNFGRVDAIGFDIYTNPSHQYWNILNEHLGCPLLKKELLLKNPTNRNLDEVMGWIDATNTLAGLNVAKHLVEMGMLRMLYQIDQKSYLESNPTYPGVEFSPLKNMKHLVFEIPKKISYSFDEDEYLRVYPDVQKGISSGTFTCAYEHFVKMGLSENRCFFTRIHDERALWNELLKAKAEIAGQESALVDLHIENENLKNSNKRLESFVKDIRNSRAFKTLSRIERIKENFR